LSSDELKSSEIQDQLKAFDLAIDTKLGSRGVPPMPNEFLVDEDAPYEPIEPEAEMPEADAYDAEMYDQYISAEIMVPKGDTLVSAKVIGRKTMATLSVSDTLIPS
jgi:hypothetical protein